MTRPLLPEDIPPELRARNQWVCWRYEKRKKDPKPTKVPYQTSGRKADSKKPTTWNSFERCWAAYTAPGSRFDGVGFAFSPDDPYAGVDLDGCVAPDGTIGPEARAVIARLNSYSEFSPSTEGVKIWVAASLPTSGKRTYSVPGFKCVEMYDRVRYFATTGWHVPGTPTAIHERQEQLTALHSEWFPEERREEPAPRIPCQPIDASDDEVLRRAESASNGAKFRALWNGDHSGYGSRSEADLALCSMVAFYVGPDADRIEQIVRRSGLIREKWNRKDYLPRTIRQALDGKTEFYGQSAPERTTTRVRGEESEDRLILDPQDPVPTARRFVAANYSHPERETLVYHDGEFCIWDGTRYAPAEIEHVRSPLYSYLEGAWCWKTSGGQRRLVPFKPTRAKLDNVVDVLRAHQHVPLVTAPPAWLVPESLGLPPAMELLPAANGLVHLDTGQVLPCTPNFFCKHCVPFACDPAATSLPEWRRFLSGIWPDDPESIETIQEWFGYSLTPDTRLQKILLVVGPPRSGKGTIGRIWTGMLGNWAVAAPTLASLESNFGLWPLIGKLVAIIADARLSGRQDQARIVERMLSISGEDTQTIDRKHMQPWTGRLGVRLVIFTNELPRLSDSSGAMANRFIVLETRKSFLDEEDTGLEARLLPELPAILNWAIEGRKRLYARGRFAQPESSSMLLEDLKQLASPTAAFVQECCDLGPQHSTSVDELYEAWCGWCHTQGREHSGDKQTFGRNLRAAVPGIADTRLRVSDDRVRCYTGIRPRGRWSAVVRDQINCARGQRWDSAGT